MKIGLLKVGDEVITLAYLEDAIRKRTLEEGVRGIVEEVDPDDRWVGVNFRYKTIWVHPMDLRRLSPLELLAECA